jgi:hypothetical protein
VATFIFVVGLILAIALGSLRIVFIACVALLCVLFPALLAVVVPAIGGGIYYVLRHL